MPDINEDNTQAREESYPNRMGQTIGAFAGAAVEADGIAKDASLARVIKILDRPNIEWAAGVGALGKPKIGMTASIPAAALADLRTFAPDTAKLTMSMKTSETNDAKEKTEAGGKFAASAKWGIGLVSVSARVSGHASHSSEKSRTTDYSATTDVEMTLKQSDPPEGVALIVQTINHVVTKGMEANLCTANKKMEEETADVESPNAPEGEAQAEGASE